MTDYYIDPDTGDDLNDGTVGTPFKTIERISETAFAAGDTISFSGSSETSLYRGEFRPEAIGSSGSPIRYLGSDSVFTSALNLTEGAEYEFQDKNYNTRDSTDENMWFNDFTGNVLDKWSNFESGNIYEETSEQLSGMASCLRLDSVGAPRVENSFLLSNAPMKMRIKYKNASGGIVSIRLRSDGDSFYAQLGNDGSFTGYAAGISTASLAESLTWTEWETDWISRDLTEASPNKVLIFGSGTTNSYIQHIGFKFRVEWQTYDADNNVYRIRVPVNEYRTVCLMKGTTAQWSESGFAGLSFVPEPDGANEAAKLANIQAGNAEGRCFLDVVSSGIDSRQLYIQLASGESISDFHLEFVANTFNNGYINADYSYLEDMKFRGGFDGVLLSGDNCKVIELDSQYSRGTGLISSGVGNEGTLCTLDNNARLFPADGVYSTRPLSGNGVKSSGGDLTLCGCTAIGNGDEGFQNDSGGTLNLDGCTAHSNWSEQVSISGGDFLSQNCTFVQGLAEGWLDHDIFNDRSDLATNDADYTRTMIDCYMDSTGSAAAAVRIGLDAEAPTNITASGCIVIGVINDDGNNTFTGQTGLETSDAGGFTNYPSDLTPAPTSVAIGTGTKWWGVAPRPLSATGKPYPDFDIDKGGIQSTHSPHDPTNL